MISIASETEVRALAAQLKRSIEAKSEGLFRTREWTDAVYEAFKEFSEGKGWDIYPKNKAKLGEYLCDFMVFDPAYGPRVACESQWWHRLGNHEGSLDWSFDKLRGVKSDIKVFIHEGTPEHFQKVVDSNLLNYALLSPDEAFLEMRWAAGGFVCSWWQPQQAGVQEEVQFTPILA